MLGSFPPYNELGTIGSRRNYFIHDGYQHRPAPQYFDDTKNSDGWQDEVYLFAREIAGKYDLKSILDIGCGSGFKLLKYFYNWRTIGIDVADTCARLQKRYPKRRWVISDFSATVTPKADLVIASDVIEHLTNPDELLDYIVRVAPKYVVISTPDRNLLRLGTHNGPPSNPAHLRESLWLNSTLMSPSFWRLPNILYRMPRRPRNVCSRSLAVRYSTANLTG